MAKRCPSCKTDVPDDVRVCPNCPYSFPEEPDNPGAPPASVGTFWTPVPLILMALAAGGLISIWLVVVNAGRGRKEHDAGIVATMRGDNSAQTLSGAAAIKPAPAVKPEASPLLRAAVDGEEEEEAATVVIAHEEGSKPAPPVKEWKMRGYVYDLITLGPVARGKLVFTDVLTNAHFETATDQTGRYRVILPPLPGRGYLVNITQTGYAPTYLNPGTENVSGMPETQRRELCKDLATAILQPAELVPHGADPLVTNFYIAPHGMR